MARAPGQCHGNLGDRADTGLRCGSCNSHDRRYELEDTDAKLELESLQKAWILQDSPAQVQGARNALPSAPGKLQSGSLHPDGLWESGSLPREIQTSCLLHVGGETKITITLWCEIPKMRNSYKNWAQRSKALETHISQVKLCSTGLFHKARCVPRALMKGKSWKWVHNVKFQGIRRSRLWWYRFAPSELETTGYSKRDNSTHIQMF